MIRRGPCLALLLLAAAGGSILLTAGCAAERGRSVVLVTIDGVRWQEVFGGAEESLLDRKDRGVESAYWRDTPEARREALLPFLWGTIARQGQILGNAARGSQVLVSNRFRISYPGYHELLCGFASEEIDSNRKVVNPDPTVLEWLHGRPGFRDQVAAYCTWDVFPYILNRERCGFRLNCGEVRARPGLLDRLKDEVFCPWNGSVFDAFTFHMAMEDLRERAPRVLYLALGDTDEWAHAGQYERYLQSIRRSDAYLRELWETLQAMPEYRGRTTLLVTTDHGRGDPPRDWRSHNRTIAGAEYIWVAAIGPGVPALGEWEEHEPFLQGQVAATVAAMVGENFVRAVPRAAPPLPVLGSRR